MLDDLDLAWEEQNDTRRRRGQPPNRQNRQRRRKEAKRRRRSFGALFVSLMLLVALGGGVYWGVGWVQGKFGVEDYDSNPAKVPVNVVVHPGDGATDIGNELYNKKVVKSAKAFVDAAAADEEHSKGIQPGTYRLFQEMPAKIALSYLIDPEKYMVVTKVTIPEGMITLDIYDKLAKASGIPVADFVAAGKDPVKLGVDPSWFGKRDNGTPVRKSIEGFLYPATYSFQPDMTAEQMLKEMVSTFMGVADELDLVNTAQSKLHITPYEALIAASIAQSEAVFPKDFAKVARVLYNRAYTDAAPCNNCLGLDSTVNYYLRITGHEATASEHLTYAQLHDPKNPFNTHDKPGMPPGAISNPGKEALQGALNPVGSAKVIYFVSIDKEGHMAYAETEAQRIANNQLACKNGIPIC